MVLLVQAPLSFHSKLLSSLVTVGLSLSLSLALLSLLLLLLLLLLLSLLLPLHCLKPVQSPPSQKRQ